MNRRMITFWVGGIVLCTAIFLFIVVEHGVSIDTIVQPIVAVIDPNADAPAQQPLANPPRPIKAIYATNWSMASDKKIKYFFDLLTTTELNAIVIDIKESTGIVGYEPDVPAIKEYGAFEKRIPKINSLIKKFHDAGIYVIGRIAVFQDNALVKARPDYAIKSKATGQVWSDRRGVHWLDTGATPVWDYNIDLAREALSRGFDEINFDYIRFPTDGDIADIVYPFEPAQRFGRRAVLKQFFEHVRSQLPYARISGDIFGEAVVNNTETSIGQFFEDTIEPFDAVAAMIYPSHFNPRFLGLANSAAEPYPVIRYAMDRTFERAKKYELAMLAARATSTTPTISISEFRPWLQDFSLGAVYDAEKVRAQIIAVDDSARAAAGCPGIQVTDRNHQVAKMPTAPRAECEYVSPGWMLWNASNVYTKGALLAE